MALDLGDDASIAPRLAHQPARLLDIRRIAGKRHRDVVDALLRTKTDVLAILVGECRRRNSAALPVQTLAVRQLASHADAGLDPCAAHALHIENDLPIVQQQGIPRAHILRKILIGAAHDLYRPRLGVERGVEREGLSLLQYHASFPKPFDTDLRTAEIEKYADTPVGNARGFADQSEAAPATVDRTVRGVEPNDIDSFAHHCGENAQVIGRRTHGGDYLRTSKHISLLFGSPNFKPVRRVYHPRARSSST